MGKKETSAPSKGKSGGGGGKAKGGGGGGDAEDMMREQKLQAILLADSFTKTFRPITWEKPKVLLPLVNVPMLDLTLEFLSLNGVEEVFVFCVWHAAMLEAYVQSSKWSSVMSIRCVTQTSCLSPGDALRELDSMGVVRSDPFVLISGDVISNMDLKRAIAFHKEKRKEDPSCVMTMVMKRVLPTTRAKSVLDDMVVGMDRHTSQIVHFEDNLKSKSVNMPIEVMLDHPAVTFRTDLLDCHVDICSPDFLLQFSDNFDYQDIRKDFIRNQAANWEMGMHIYGYQLQNEYAARVLDPRTYHIICRDIVTRWVYPIVPDANILQDGVGYTHLRRYVYKEPGVRVHRSAIVGEGVVMGKDSVIEANARVERTIIGRNCVIGTGAMVVESHLWSGARVDAGANVEHAIICDGARVMKGARVGRGCVLAFGTVVGAGVLLPDYTRVSLQRKLEDSEQAGSRTSSNEPYDTDILGPDGVGYVWSLEDCGESVDGDGCDDDSEDGDADLVDVLKARSMGCSEEVHWRRSLWEKVPAPIVDSDDEEDYDADEIADQVEDEGEDENGDLNDADGLSISDDDESPGNRGGGSDDDMGDAGSDDDEGIEAVTTNAPQFLSEPETSPSMVTFYKNVNEMIISARAEGHPADSTLLEIKSYKFAQNKTFLDCLNGAIPALMTIFNQPPSVTGTAVPTQKQLVAHIQPLLAAGSWGNTILKTLVFDKFDQLAVIEITEREVLRDGYSATLYPLFRLFLQLYYDSGLVTEETLLQWAASRDKFKKEGSNSFVARVITLYQTPLVQQFVDWLREDDDDDEEDDSNEDGSEEDN